MEEPVGQPGAPGLQSHVPPRQARQARPQVRLVLAPPQRQAGGPLHRREAGVVLERPGHALLQARLLLAAGGAQPVVQHAAPLPPGPPRPAPPREAPLSSRLPASPPPSLPPSLRRAWRGVGRRSGCLRRSVSDTSRRRSGGGAGARPAPAVPVQALGWGAGWREGCRTGQLQCSLGDFLLLPRLAWADARDVTSIPTSTGQLTVAQTAVLDFHRVMESLLP